MLLAGFVVLERRSRQPLLPPRVVTVGIALLSTSAATATNSFIARHGRSPDVIADAAVRVHTTAFWWSAGIFAAGAVVCGLLLRPGVPRLEAAAEPVAAAA